MKRIIIIKGAEQTSKYIASLLSDMKHSAVINAEDLVTSHLYEKREDEEFRKRFEKEMLGVIYVSGTHMEDGLPVGDAYGVNFELLKKLISENENARTFFESYGNDKVWPYISHELFSLLISIQLFIIPSSTFFQPCSNNVRTYQRSTEIITIDTTADCKKEIMGDLDFVVCASLGYDILKSTILRVRKAIEERIAKMEGAKEFINRTYYSGEVVALIQTHDQIETCLTKRLRQEYVKKWKVDVQFIMKRFDEWMKNQPTGEKRFYVLFTDENTGPMGNDGWGDNTLWECSLTHEGVLSGTCVVSIPQ